jgi:small subunit ribosomal protein S1
MDSSEIVTSPESPEEVVEAPPEAEEEEEFQMEGYLDSEDEDELQEESTAEMGELPLEDWDYQRPKRGQVRTGVILAIRDQEIIVDVDAKRDGVVPFADMQRMGAESIQELSVGDEVPVYVLRPEDADGNLLVSLYHARAEKAWQRAAELADSGEVWEGEVIGYNKGGLVVPLDDIRGFVPASQVPGFPRGLSQEDRLQRLSEKVGETLQVKVIEINRRNRRLILSATSAQRQWRKRQRERLFKELREGEVRTGTVSSLCSFGAFVDLGGADGLVHISELSWQRVRHPREVVSVGDEVDVYVLRLEPERKRIGLSLKRLQPEPWALVEDKYELGQLVEGVVTNVVDFGAFAEIEEGIEGLIHVSELTEGTIAHPRDVVKKGDLLLLRIIRIDARRKRLGLSLKRVLESEWAEWAARLAVAEEEKRAAEEAEKEREAAKQVEEEAQAAAEAEKEPAAVEAEEEPKATAEAKVLPEAVEAEEEPEATAEAKVQPEATAEADKEPAVVEAEEEPKATAEAEEQPAAVEAEEEPEAIAEAEEQPAAVEAEEEPEAAAEAEEEAPGSPQAEEETEGASEAEEVSDVPAAEGQELETTEEPAGEAAEAVEKERELVTAPV